MNKLETLKEAIALLEGKDLEKLKSALAVIGEPIVESSSAATQILGSKIKIVVLQRGWVVVGSYSHNATEATLENAATIRVWGTTKGLGELAQDGPTSTTKLDKAGTIRFERLTSVLVLDVKDDAKWLAKLS